MDGLALNAAGRPFPGVVRLIAIDGIGVAREVRTSPRGAYSFGKVTPGRYRLDLLVERTAVGSQPVSIEGDAHINLKGLLETAGEEITVTATGTETRLADTPASIVIVTRRDLERSGGVTLDDALRQIPGFTLFRRTGSLAANPTTQGASLRGIGASAASRTTVLDDGVPLNDAFGGWVYWGRVPRAAIDRVEVRRGGSSELFGSAAMGGAINLFRAGKQTSSTSVDFSYGELQTGTASFATSGSHDRWFGALAGESFGSDGYFLLRNPDRGQADRPAGSTHHSLDVTGGVNAGTGRYFIRAGLYDESRANGTRLQHNRTDLRHATLGADWHSGVTTATARLFSTDQDYEQTFSSLSADHNFERLTRRQRVPSSSVGLNARFSTALSEHLVIVTGMEGRELSGSSIERSPSARGETVQSAGGKQMTGGLFGELLFAPVAPLSISVAIREDFWRNFDAFRADGPRRALATRSDSFFSPRISALFHVTDRVAVNGTGYRAFRAPTLNELYRSFRVGNVVTLGNEDLEAEHLEGAEIGTIATSAEGKGSVRANVFSMRVLNTIANVTTSMTPSLITRQRQNLGRTRTDGLEIDASWREAAWSMSAGYLFSNARVRSFPAAPELEGLRLPQVPRSQISLQGAFDSGTYGQLALQARWVGQQFDDDQNQLALRSFVSVDANFSLPVGPGLRLYLAGENVFDRRYDVGRTPQLTLGPPRIVRLGVQWGRI